MCVADFTCLRDALAYGRIFCQWLVVHPFSLCVKGTPNTVGRSAIPRLLRVKCASASVGSTFTPLVVKVSNHLPSVNFKGATSAWRYCVVVSTANRWFCPGRRHAYRACLLRSPSLIPHVGVEWALPSLACQSEARKVLAEFGDSLFSSRMVGLTGLLSSTGYGSADPSSREHLPSS